MRRIASIGMAVLMAAALCACTAAETETTAAETSAAQTEAATTAATTAAAAVAETTTAEETTEASANMINPMVEITDTEEFEKQLGIPINAGLLYGESRMFITNGEFAECQFSFSNPMGEEVSCTLRATKDPEVGEHLTGIYEKLKEVNNIDYEGTDGVFVIKVESTEDGNTTVYTWQNNDTWYSFVIKGAPSQMEVAEAMDSVMSAIGQLESSTAEELPWYELSSDDEILTVRLRSNPTTGYQWSYKIEWPEAVEEITSEYVEDEHEEGMVGVGGEWVCSYRVTAPYDCRTDIRFTYSRSWEEGSIPTKTLDLNLIGKKFEVTGVHEPDLNTEAAPDGTYDIVLSFEDMLEENELSFYAVADIVEPVVLTDEQVQNLKVGDTLELSRTWPGAWDVEIQKLEKVSDERIDLDDVARLVYDKDLGGWKILDWDDAVDTYVVKTVLIHFTNETALDDQMEEILKTGNSGTIYDKMRDYTCTTLNVTVKDGTATDTIIYYHP